MQHSSFFLSLWQLQSFMSLSVFIPLSPIHVFFTDDLEDLFKTVSPTLKYPLCQWVFFMHKTSISRPETFKKPSLNPPSENAVRCI